MRARAFVCFFTVAPPQAPIMYLEGYIAHNRYSIIVCRKKGERKKRKEGKKEGREGGRRKREVGKEGGMWGWKRRKIGKKLGRKEGEEKVQLSVTVSNLR